MERVDINLIKSQTEFSPQISSIEKKLRFFSMITVITLIVIGTLTAGTYIFLKAKRGNLMKQQDALTKAIALYAKKEGFYLFIKDRTGLVLKAIPYQKKWSGVMDTVLKIAPPPALVGFSVDEKEQVTLQVATASVEDLFPIADAVGRETKDGHIKNPVLAGVQLGKGGAVKAIITLSPIL